MTPPHHQSGEPPRFGATMSGEAIQMAGDRQGGRRGNRRKAVGLSLRCLRPILLERLVPTSGVQRRQVTRRHLSGEMAPDLGH